MLCFTWQHWCKRCSKVECQADGKRGADDICRAGQDQAFQQVHKVTLASKLLHPCKHWHNGSMAGEGCCQSPASPLANHAFQRCSSLLIKSTGKRSLLLSTCVLERCGPACQARTCGGCNRYAARPSNMAHNSWHPNQSGQTLGPSHPASACMGPLCLLQQPAPGGSSGALHIVGQRGSHHVLGGGHAHSLHVA